MRRKLQFQYYYKQDDCPAQYANAVNCKCWHDEGSGPYANERHDADTPLVDWRIKPLPQSNHGRSQST